MRVDHAKVDEARTKAEAGLTKVECLALASALVGHVQEEIEFASDPTVCTVLGLLEAATTSMDSAVDYLEPLDEAELDG